MREVEETGRGRCVCVCVCASLCVYSLLDILDLHAGCAAAAGAHERLRPQLRDLCTPSLNTQTHTNINHPADIISATVSPQHSNSQLALNFK